MIPLEYANLSAGPGRRERRVWWRSALFSLLWIGVATVVMVPCAGISLGVSPLLGGLLFLAPIVALAAGYKMLEAVRRRRGMAVLSHIEQAVRLNLPLPRMLYAAQLSETGALRKRLLHAQELASGGVDVGTILDEAVPELPKRVAGLASVAQRSGCLDTALDEISKQLRRRPLEDAATGSLYLVYPFVFLMTMGALSLMSIFVFPRFEDIFADFNIPIRGPWAIVRGLAPLFPLFTLVLMVGLTITIGMMLWQIFMPGRWDDSHLRDAGDSLLWLIPGGRGYLQDRALADICSVSADAMDAGRPLGEALLEVSMVQFPPPMRARVSRWRQGIESGHSADEAAKRAGMPALLVGLVRTGLAGGNLPESMHFLARYYQGRFSRTGELLRGALIPALALLMGLLVAAVALSLFIPLIDLVEAAISVIEAGPI